MAYYGEIFKAKIEIYYMETFFLKKKQIIGPKKYLWLIAIQKRIRLLEI
jgi:hypothetical protein